MQSNASIQSAAFILLIECTITVCILNASVSPAATVTNDGANRNGSASSEKTSRDRLAETRDWLERFSHQLRKAFAQYSRVELVRKALQEADPGGFNAKNDVAQQIERFERVANEVTRRLNSFFRTKIQAVKNLAVSVEAVSRDFDAARQKTSPKTPDERADECKILKHLIEATTLRDDDALTVKNVTNSHDYRTQDASQQPNTSVHVALVEYKCDDRILDDFAFTNHNKIAETMRKNLAFDAQIGRQYVATHNGLTRIYPAFKWDTLPRDYTVDLFDSRLRPWFMATESAPRDVLFLIDYSGSMRGVTLHVTKTLVQQVLGTLSPNDFFTGVWYNSRRDLVLADCLPRRHGGAGARFLPATTRNKQLFQRYLDRVEDRDQATLPAALNLSFTQFLQNSRSDASGGAWERERRTSGGHKLVLLFSDGVEIWPVDVVKQFQSQYPDDKIRVFGYSMGRGASRLPALDWLSCATGGGMPPHAVSQAVGTIAEVRIRSRSYLEKLSEILALAYSNRTIDDRPISWSMPYMDAQKLGAVLTLAVPILDWRSMHAARAAALNLSGEGNASERATARFRAVVGIDVTMRDLRAQFGAFGAPHLSAFEANSEGNGGATTYAFIVDNNGIVHYHPRLKLPKTETYLVRRTACHRIGKAHRNSNTRLQYGRADERVRRVMGQLDSVPTVDMLELEFRPSNSFRKFREKIIAGECTDEHGHALRDETQKRNYRCYHIAGTPFTIGFVYAEQMTRPIAPGGHPLAGVQPLAKKSKDSEKKIGNPMNQTEEPENDPLDYWLHDTQIISHLCNGSDLSDVDRARRYAALRQMLAEGRCRQSAVPRRDFAAAGDAFFLLDEDALAETSAALLRGAHALLKRWRVAWPPARNNLTATRPHHIEVRNATTKRIRSAVPHRHRRRKNDFDAARSNASPGAPAATEKRTENTPACTLNGTQFVLPRTFDARYFLSAFVDLPIISLSAFFPKCQSSNVSSVIDVYLSHAQLAPLPKSERLKLRVDVSRLAVAGDLSEGADMSLLTAAGGAPTLVVVEKLHRAGDPTAADALAAVGAQFAPQFLHDKFQRSLNATSAEGAKSWPECKMTNRRCYLLTTSGYVVASTEKNFAPIVHLAVLEPQIFEHLIKGEVIQKTTWTDYQAECAVSSSGGADPLNVRKQLEFQRQLFDSLFGGAESSSSSEEEDQDRDDGSAAAVNGSARRPTDASAALASAASCAHLQRVDLMQALWRFSSLWFNAFARIEATFGLFAGLISSTNSMPIATHELGIIHTVEPEEDEEEENLPRTHNVDDVPPCEYGSSSDAATLSRERCVVEHTLYTLRARQTLSVKSVHYRIGCNSDLIIVPSTSAQLHLLILDEKCDNFPTIPTAHRVMPHRVPDCSLTSTRSRRLRADLDYTRAHPEEFVAECSSRAASSPRRYYAPHTTIGLFSIILAFGFSTIIHL